MLERKDILTSLITSGVRIEKTLSVSPPSFANLVSIETQKIVAKRDGSIYGDDGKENETSTAYSLSHLLKVCNTNFP